MQRYILPVSASLSLLVVAISCAYYLVYYLPEKNQLDQQIELKRIEQQQKEFDASQASVKNQEQLQVVRDYTLKECQDELEEKYGDDGLSDSLDTLSKVDTFSSLYITNCMRRSGYSEY